MIRKSGNRFSEKIMLSSKLSLQLVAQSGGDLVLGGRLSDQALDDGGRGVRRDRADMAHGGGAGRGDRLLCRRQPLVELCLEPLVGRLGRGRLLLARLGGNRLRAAASVGERLLVSGVRGVGLLLETLRRFEIVADAFAALGKDRA